MKEIINRMRPVGSYSKLIFSNKNIAIRLSTFDGEFYFVTISRFDKNGGLIGWQSFFESGNTARMIENEKG